MSIGQTTVIVRKQSTHSRHYFGLAADPDPDHPAGALGVGAQDSYHERVLVLPANVPIHTAVDANTVYGEWCYQPQMVEVGLILLHRPIEMPLTQDEEEVEAFPPHAAQRTLANSIGLRLSWPNIPIRQAARGYDELSCDCQL